MTFRKFLLISGNDYDFQEISGNALNLLKVYKIGLLAVILLKKPILSRIKIAKSLVQQNYRNLLVTQLARRQMIGGQQVQRTIIILPGTQVPGTLVRSTWYLVLS